MASYKVFRAVPVITVGWKSPTQVTLLPVPGNDGSVDFTVPTFDIDLSATPTRGVWDTVQVDDRGVDRNNQMYGPALNQWLLQLGITTIGPVNTNRILVSTMIGVVYVEDSRYQKITVSTNPQYPWPPPEYPCLYQLTSIAYRANTSDPYAGKRYHGFCCTVVDVKASLISVTCALPGKQLLGPVWLDTSNPDDCCAAPPPEALAGLAAGQKSLTASPQIGDTGSIYISLPRAIQLDMGPGGPKIPIGEA
jgi:hypothetical protein